MEEVNIGFGLTAPFAEAGVGVDGPACDRLLGSLPRFSGIGLPLCDPCEVERLDC